MEWKSLIDSMSRSVKSIACSNMGPNEKVSDKSWFSGQNLFEKLVTSAGSSFTQTKSCLSSAGSRNQAPTLLRLDSQGEVVSPESFPVIGPPEEIMAWPQKPANGHPGWGWHGLSQKGCPPRPPVFNHRSFNPNGLYHSNRAFTSYAGRSCSRYPGNSASQQWYQPQVPPYVRNLHSYAAVTPQCMDFTNGVWSSGVYQFQGNGFRNYRDSYLDRHGQNMAGANMSKGRSQRPHKRKGKTLPSKSGASQGADISRVHDSGQIQSSDVTYQMARLDISSETAAGHGCAHDDSHAPKVESLPKMSQSSSGTLEDKTTLVLTPVSPKVTSCQGAKNICDERSIVSNDQDSDPLSKHDCLGHGGVNDDRFLALELCGSSDVKLNDAVNATPPGSVPSTFAHHSTVVGTVQPTNLHATCFLTPKTACIAGSKKKKTRPSSKKRQRRKHQANPDAPVIQIKGHAKKQKTDGSNSDIRPDCDMSFLIDFSESSESDNIQFGASPNAVGSPPITKFSLFISAAEFDESTESESESSDSDFYEEANSETPKKNSQPWNSVVTDLECFSPFTFQITCNVINPSHMTNHSQNKEPKDCTDSGADEFDAAVEESHKRAMAANNRWQLFYGDVLGEEWQENTKIHFPKDHSLATVHTLAPDEVEDYEAARKGPWEQYARDRERFKKRIMDVEKTIAPCLDPGHRQNISDRLKSML